MTMVVVLSKHVVLIMRIINIIINMDNITQEMPNEDPILRLNNKIKKTSLNKKFDTNVKISMAFQALKK